MGIISLLFITELCFIFLAYVISQGNLLSPSLISYLMFAIATVCVLLNVDSWDVSYSWRTYGLVVAGFLAMALPELIIVQLKRRITSSENRYIRDVYEPIIISPFFNKILSCIAIFFTLYMFYDVFFSAEGFSVYGLYAIGMAKYETGVSIITRLSVRYCWILFFCYIYVVLNNTIRCHQNIKDNIKYSVPFVTVILSNFITGSRGAIIEIPSVVFVLAIVMITETTARGNVKITKILKKIIIFGMIILSVFYTMRGISKVNSIAAKRSFIDYITYYIGSPLYLLDKYLSAPFRVHGINKHLGQQTFSSIYLSLGIEVDYIGNQIPIGGNSGFAGNEFSWFQRPYADFGFFGMLFFTFIVYFFFSWLLYIRIDGVRHSARRLRALIIFSYFYYIIVMSFYYCQVCLAISPINIACVLIIYMMLYLLEFKKIRVKM